MKRQLKTWVIGLGLTLGMAGAASAHLTSLGLYGWEVLGNPDSEAEKIEDFLDDLFSLDIELSYLEKYNYGTGFDGTGNAPEDPPNGADYTIGTTTATPITSISWDLSGTDWLAGYVLVKDGRAKELEEEGGPNLTYYHLYEVSIDQLLVGGPHSVQLDGSKGISHISWFGVFSDPQQSRLPEGGMTIGLMGILLVAGEALRRRLGR